MTGEQFEMEYKAVARDIDALYEPKARYYEQYEPGRWPRLMEDLHQKDTEGTKAADYQSIIDAAVNIRYELDRDHARLSRAISSAEIKRIHVMKGKCGLGDDEYRELLIKHTGKVSSTELVYWQAMIVLRALYDIEKAAK